MTLEQIIRNLPPAGLTQLLLSFEADEGAFFKDLRKVLEKVGEDFTVLSKNDYAELMRRIPEWVEFTLEESYSGAGEYDFNDYIEGFNGLSKKKVSQYIRETQEVSEYVRELLSTEAWNTFAEFSDEFKPLFVDLMRSKSRDILRDPKKILDYAKQHGHDGPSLSALKGVWSMFDFCDGFDEVMKETYFSNLVPTFLKKPSPPAYPD